VKGSLGIDVVVGSVGDRTGFQRTHVAYGMVEETSGDAMAIVACDSRDEGLIEVLVELQVRVARVEGDLGSAGALRGGAVAVRLRIGSRWRVMRRKGR
jgi:hypothetical protein